VSIRNLDRMFRPGSVALIGATDRPGSVGAQVLRNLQTGGFQGSLFPVNPKRASVGGLRCYPTVASLPEAPDLAVICTPPAGVPASVAALGNRGTKAAVILTAGLNQHKEIDGRTVRQEVLEAAQPHFLRILGSNSIGLLVPGIGLNASFAHVPAQRGNVAFVSQSGALCTVVLDWAQSRGIGFSHFISLGDSIDVDFGDVIDYLAGDHSTKSILLYVESVKQARKFMSAARAAARNKPIVAVKAGRSALGARAAASHTGALAGNDAVFSAAFRRAGIVRVDGVEELFEAVETLSRVRAPAEDGIAILTNGGGPGVVAVDALMERGGRLASLGAATISSLDQILPSTWSRGNPVDIIGDADGGRFAGALDVVVRDPEVSAVLVLYSPTAMVSATKTAEAIIETAAKTEKPILAAWLGGTSVAAARRLLSSAGIASYETPESAVRGFQRLIEYRRSQAALLQVPAQAEVNIAIDRREARSAIQDVLDQGRREMTGPESRQVLQAYGIPFAKSVTASDADAAARVADAIGYPVVLKVLSPDIGHKSDIGGVALNLRDSSAVRRAGDEITERARRLRPDAQLAGFTVEQMVERPKAHELLVGATTDRIFGPVIAFGQGGTAVEVVADTAVALPPLNISLATELMGRTRISRRLAGYRNEPATNGQAIADVLVQVSQLLVDNPEIVELDINPLLADQNGTLAVDARISVEAARPGCRDRLAIRPYPQDLSEEIALKSGQRFLVRPIRPEDTAAHRRFFESLSPEDIRFRFFADVSDMDPSQLARFAQIDYDREMAFIAVAMSGENKGETVAVVRAVSDPDNDRAEFAITVGSKYRRLGLGRRLLDKIVCYCRQRGTQTLVGYIMPDNTGMLHLARSLGFSETLSPEGWIEARLALSPR
jgi:acetyltransferase